MTTLKNRFAFPNRYAVILQWLLFSAIGVLYINIANNSFGYDDEYFNIRIVTDNSLADMVRIVETNDIHPPLSYIINFVLFKALHNWNHVRVCSAVFFLMALAYTVFTTKDKNRRWLLLLLLGLNPTILLWGTGLRWYAYALPVLMVLGQPSDYRRTGYWWRFFLGFLVIFYLGYIGFILCIPYFLYYWINDKNRFKTKALRILAPLAVFVAAYAWQLYVFLTVHTKTQLDNNQQVFDLKTSILAVVSSCFSNQGVFPLSYAGMVAIAGTAIVLLAAALSFREVNKEKHWLVFAVSAILMIVTGLAGKIRNLVLLEPSRTGLLAGAASLKKNRWVWAGVALLSLGNIVGVWQVLHHTQTSKNAWNLPLDEALAVMEQTENTAVQEIYFTHNPTFTYYLATRNKNLLSFYNTLYFDSSRIKTSVKQLSADTASRKNLTFILTYRGNSITVPYYNRMTAPINGLVADSVVRIHLGEDKEYLLKRKYFPDYPRYTVELIKAYGVKRVPPELAAWERLEQK
jgi:hypothetical protein